MSQVAGRMSMQVAAWALMKTKRGRGILLGGVPGVMPAKVVIIGRRRFWHQRCGNRGWDARGHHGFRPKQCPDGRTLMSSSEAH